MNLHQRETFRRKEREEHARIEALLAEMQRSLQIIKANIEAEESRTPWPSPDDPRYPIMGRALRTRHDNLAATIRVIEERAREMTEPAA